MDTKKAMKLKEQPERFSWTAPKLRELDISMDTLTAKNAGSPDGVHAS
jgi:hypothetical protein